MKQIFRPRANALAKMLIVGVVGIVALGAYITYAYTFSPWSTGVGIVRDQPVPFSHEHHVGGLGLDCRYCHTSVEKSSFAGIPSTEICMNCHSRIWTEGNMLKPVRESWVTGKPIAWTRVHDLPDFVFFNHSIHVNKGVGCETCHGRVDEMPIMHKANSLYMHWCLDCHRNPAPHLRPKDEVFTMGWKPPENRKALGRKLAERYDIRENLAECYTCHR